VTIKRRRAIGAEIVDGGVHFRVWAPAWDAVAVVIDGRATALDREEGGYFSKLIASAHAGTRYRFRLGNGDYPDPASRSQPDGPHGESEVVDPLAFEWQSSAPRIDDRIIIEIHIGTFTPVGTFAAAIEKLPLLADAGINTLEVMPIAEFPGRFGWGYDGVDLWAPTRLYGRPDDFRRFIDAAHALGLAVILDVVYNHFGPDGCYVAKFSPSYFMKKYPTEWGEAINFEEPGVRELMAENAAYWIDEFHLDGLRLDATQSIHDNSECHVIREITDRARAAARGREIYVVAENEPQDVRLLKELGVDALWNDDWHHSASVALTGRREAYYTDYGGKAQEFVSMARLGFLFQGQWYSWQKQPRGTPSVDIPPPRLVCSLQTHEQSANSATGERIQRLASIGSVRAMTALLLLAPQTPMLFQGQEFAASSRFLYFADHKPELAKLVAEGRREFLRQFPSIKDSPPAPHDPQTFETCKLDWSERETNADVVDFHRQLIRLRRTLPKTRPEGAVLNDHAFVLRWFETQHLLIVNSGEEIDLDSVPEPLLAPPLHKEWSVIWSSIHGGPAPSPVPPSPFARTGGGACPPRSATLFTSTAGAQDRRDRDRAT
jgi:maltooligosyltrehalose trehalohydrolase